MLSCLGRKVTVFAHSGVPYGSVSLLGDKASTTLNGFFLMSQSANLLLFLVPILLHPNNVLLLLLLLLIIQQGGEVPPNIWGGNFAPIFCSVAPHYPARPYMGMPLPPALHVHLLHL